MKAPDSPEQQTQEGPMYLELKFQYVIQHDKHPDRLH